MGPRRLIPVIDPGQRGRFITFEGGEGVGKSTQITGLADWLEHRGIACRRTREPGGAPGAEEIRQLLVTGEPDRWDAVAEALLMNAARRDHVVSTIRPALERGVWVLCDRFLDSTLVYQGHAGQVPVRVLDALIDAAVDDTRPDLTIILDMDPELGLSRAGDRGGREDRFERKGPDFHASVRRGFCRIAEDQPERCVLIDANRPIEKVASEISALVAQRFLEAG